MNACMCIWVCRDLHVYAVVYKLPYACIFSKYIKENININYIWRVKLKAERKNVDFYFHFYTTL